MVFLEQSVQKILEIVGTITVLKKVPIFVCFCCLFLTSSRPHQFDQRIALDDRHSCDGAHGMGYKKKILEEGTNNLSF